MIYIRNSVNFTQIKKMTECIDNLYECVTIEMCNYRVTMRKGKKLVSCIYRTPASSIELFNETIDNYSSR